MKSHNILNAFSNDTTIRSGNLFGENVYMEVGGDLRLETLQNYNKFESKNASASVTFSMAGITGASASYGQTDAKRRWSDNVSNITGQDRVAINVGGNTDLIGSLINSESGNLALSTETLTFRDLNDSDKLFSINVSISTNGGGGIMGGIGFSLTDDDKRGITRATVGEGTINVRSDADGHSLDGLNRDVTQVQEVTKDDHFGMHMTVPIIDPDQMVEEGKVVIPTAYAMYETSANTIVSIGITPGILLERFFLDGIPTETWNWLDSGGEAKTTGIDNWLGFPYSTFKASIDDYNTHYLIGQYAYEYHPEYLPALFADRIPILGNYLPSPIALQGQEPTQRWYFGGVADKKTYEQSRDRSTEAYYAEQGVNVIASQYDHGSAFEVLAAGIFGFNARGVEALNHMLSLGYNEQSTSNTLDGVTINAVAHSGGGMRVLQASRYAGYLNASFYDVSVVQSPVIGWFQNVQELHLYENFSPADKEVTSMIGTVTSPFLFSSKGIDYETIIQFGGERAIHLQNGDKEIKIINGVPTVIQIGNYFDDMTTENLQNSPSNNKK